MEIFFLMPSDFNLILSQITARAIEPVKQVSFSAWRYWLLPLWEQYPVG